MRTSVEAAGASVAVGARVWIRAPEDCRDEVWVKGEVLEGGREMRLELTDEVVAVPEEFLICNDEVMTSSGIQSLDDLTQLTHLHEAAILNSLNGRFDADAIYTYTGPILIAVNPFKRIRGLYDDEILRRYIDKAYEQVYSVERVPHVFSVAVEAYHGLCRGTASGSKTGAAKSGGNDQTILISGESGAGKTESTKFVMKLLAMAGSSEDKKSTIENQVLQSNPLLEAFGNAKTLRNDNSSRFGKFIEMQFTLEQSIKYAGVIGRLSGAEIHTYLLETVRVCRQLLNERNFHAFYQLAAAVRLGPTFTLTPEMVDECLGLNGEGKVMNTVLAQPVTYDFSSFEEMLSNRYVSCSGCVSIPGVDDLDEFKRTCIAMTTVQITPEEQQHMWQLLGTILLLGSIYFSSSGPSVESCKVDASMRENLETVSGLLGVKPDLLEKALTTRMIIVQREKYTKGLTVDQAEDARDALARALYHTMFQRIVRATNSSIGRSGNVEHSDLIATPTPDTSAAESSPDSNTLVHSKPSVVSCGVLDIFGFECFDVNSFEQLCINYTNERLQQFFNMFIFKCEEVLYKEEGIQWDPLDFPDNQDCVDLLATNKLSILCMLDEECIIPKGSDQSLCSKLKEQYKTHKRFKPIKTRQDWFVVDHFAGPVNYCSKGFLDKNRDQLGVDIQDCIKASENRFISHLFNNYLDRGHPPAASGGSAGKMTKKKLMTVSLEFRNQLNSLMDTIDKTDPHFIRCVKPNPKNKADLFHRPSVAEQLRYAGVLQAVQVSRAGYPVRDTHVSFWQNYRCLLPKQLRQQLQTESSGSMSDRERATVCLKSLDQFYNIPKAPHGDGYSWAVGETMIFLKSQAYAVLSTKSAERRQEAVKQIQAVWNGARTRRWYVAAREAILTIQCAVRSRQARTLTQLRREARAALTITRIAQGFLVRVSQRSKHKSATAIQRRIRGIQGRAYVKNLKEHKAATKLQAWLRSRCQQIWYRKVHASIVAIQLKQKRLVAKRKLQELRAEARNTSSLQNKVNDLQKELTDAKSRIQQLEALNSATGQELTDLKLKNKKLQLDLDSAQTALHEAQNARHSAEDALRVSEEALRAADVAIQDLQQAPGAASMVGTPTAGTFSAGAPAHAVAGTPTAGGGTPTALRAVASPVARAADLETIQRLQNEVAELHKLIDQFRGTGSVYSTDVSRDASRDVSRQVSDEDGPGAIDARARAGASGGRPVDEAGTRDMSKTPLKAAGEEGKSCTSPVTTVPTETHRHPSADSEAPRTEEVAAETAAAEPAAAQATTVDAGAVSSTDSEDEAWEAERQKLEAEATHARRELETLQNTLRTEVGGNQEYLDCVLKVLKKEGQVPLPDVLFCCSDLEALVQNVFVAHLTSHITHDELNMDRLKAIAHAPLWTPPPADGQSAESVQNAQTGQTEKQPKRELDMLFVRDNTMSTLKVALYRPGEMEQLLDTPEYKPSPTRLRSSTVVFFNPVLESAEHTRVWSKVSSQGSVGRVILVDRKLDASVVNYCAKEYALNLAPASAILPWLQHTTKSISAEKICLVKSLQDLKETLRTKTPKSAGSRNKTSNPVTELIHMIPSLFSGGNGKSTKSGFPRKSAGLATYGILEDSLPPAHAAGHAAGHGGSVAAGGSSVGTGPGVASPKTGSSASVWQEMQVPNKAAVTCVCFAPVHCTRRFFLLCAGTKSGAVYAFKVAMTERERQKYEPGPYLFEQEANDAIEKEWREPPEQYVRLWKPLDGHERAVTSMFFSQEGEYLITTSVDCSVRFWDYRHGYPAKIFSDSVPILVAKMMPTNPKCFFTSNAKSVIRLVNSEEGQVVQRMKVDSEIRAICFDVAGLNMLAGTKDGSIATYEVGEDSKLQYLDKVSMGSTQSAVTSVLFVPGAPNHLVVNLADNYIITCQINYGLTSCSINKVVVKKRIKNPHNCLPITSCLIRQEDYCVCISASEDHKLKVLAFNDNDFEVVEELKGHSYATLSVTTTNTKSLLASSDVVGLIKLWRS
ncbi:myosin F [Gregarina niphandrodes]|uniref:Myosin F n=1 Tax=Gregarina niphandrodes TaxID=110365 RepID=A0A023B4T0_GRENI|nr:myosin F [Gregarina niphandrodes]EZG57259.1 myosin F [Gregarina niphandrodes]|eukprot:XP_011131066.1 myosin F [Gregarina niphandrodes]